MTFSKIAYKMLKANVKKYLLYILCNTISTAVLYSFLSIAVNEQFMNPTFVNPMISSNIYAPTYLIVIFAGIFSPYAQTVFMKTRQKDYGILSTLGMTENEVTKNIIAENFILCFISLIGGLIVGVALSFFFWLFIKSILGIEIEVFVLSKLACGITTVYMLATFSISFIINIIAMTKRTVYERIKYTRKSEGGKYHNIILALCGIGLTLLAFTIMILYYRINSNIWLVSISISILGSIFLFINGESIIEYYRRKKTKKYIRNLFLFSDIKYYYGRNKKLFIATTWIIFTILFFSMICFVTYPNFKNNAITYHPFHMEYGVIAGKVKPIEYSELKSICQKKNNDISSFNAIEFLRTNIVTIFCVEDINTILKENFRVEKNMYLYVYPYDLNDGYEYDISNPLPQIEFTSNNKRVLDIEDVIIEPLFGRVNCISSRIILINKEDFDWIKQKDSDHLNGMLYLCNFENWKESMPIIIEVRNKLMKSNNFGVNDNFFDISSRIEAFNTASRSSNFLIFSIFYVNILLYFAAVIMIHFKLRMEFADEKKKYNALYRIGIKEMEIKQLVLRKVMAIYGIPFVYAVIITLGYGYYVNSSYSYGKVGLLCALMATILFMIAHYAVYKIYSTKYFLNIIEDLK